MIPIVTITTPKSQLMVNLVMIQAISLAECGVEVFMAHPGASFFLECSPAEAKRVFAVLYNAVQRLNGVALEPVEEG